MRVGLCLGVSAQHTPHFLLWGRNEPPGVRCARPLLLGLHTGALCNEILQTARKTGRRPTELGYQSMLAQMILGGAFVKTV